jgi:hypothetical protein
MGRLFNARMLFGDRMIAKCALYFGCWDRPGHYLHDADGRTVWDRPSWCHWNVGLMDGGLLANGRHPDIPDGRVWWTCGGREDLVYAFFWWDRSVDTRGACNSGFYVRGFSPEIITPETAKENAALAFAFACDAFPQVVARQRFPLVLQP